MFTGIIEEKGQIIDIKRTDEITTMKFSAKNVLSTAKIGDSICVNGVCLTITERNENWFSADLMNETIRRTSFSYSKLNDEVNLEKSLTVSDYLDGHLVYGDVDFFTEIINIEEDGEAKVFTFKQNPNYSKYFVEKGRAVIEGVSLTLITATEESFSVSLIPHTLKNVTLGNKKIGDLVNIESDILAKHLDKISNDKQSEVIEDFFKIKKQVRSNLMPLDEKLIINKEVSTKLNTIEGNFIIEAFTNNIDNLDYIVLRTEKITNNMILRLHSKCFTGDTFHSLYCDCYEQLQESKKIISESNNGMIIYLDQEGRGIGLINKLKSYELQRNGMDTLDANLHLGFAGDLRRYDIAREILKTYNIEEIRLLSNNPEKISEMEKSFTVSREEIIIKSNPDNEKYLKTKKDRMGQLL